MGSSVSSSLSSLTGRVRAARFPLAAPPWPASVPRPDPERRVGLEYDHEWSRRYPVRLARAMVLDNVTRPAARLLAPPTIRGLEHLQHLDGPVIFAANHASHIDTPLLLTTLPVEFRHRTVVAAASDYFFDRTWKSVLWSFALAAIPIERSRVNRKSSDTAAELLDDGWSLVIFPEAGRSPDGWTQPFHAASAGYLGKRTGRPVVPVYRRGPRPGARRLGDRVTPRRAPAPLPHRRPVRGAHDPRRGREHAALLRAHRGRGRHARARGPLGLVAGPARHQRRGPCAGRGHRSPRARGFGVAPGLGPRRAARTGPAHGVAGLSARLMRPVALRGGPAA
jgi:1-acyl-sn-glycerol-3-phosphate acyltransferase